MSYSTLWPVALVVGAAACSAGPAPSLGAAASPAPTAPALDPTAGWQAASQPWTPPPLDSKLPAYLPPPVADTRRTFHLASDGTITYRGFVLCRADMPAADVHLGRQLRDVRAVGLAAKWLNLVHTVDGGRRFQVVDEVFALRAASDATWGAVDLLMKACSQPDVAFWKIELSLEPGSVVAATPPPASSSVGSTGSDGDEAEVLHPRPHSEWVTPETGSPDGVLADGTPTWRDMAATKSLRTIHIAGDGVRWQDDRWFGQGNGGGLFEACMTGLKRLRRQGLAEGFLQLESVAVEGETRRAIAQQLHLAIDGNARYRDVAILADACKATGFGSVMFGPSPDAGRGP